LTNPGAKSLFDLGVRCKPRSETTRGMIAAFDSMLIGTILDASQASSNDFETSEQNPFGDECHLRSSRDPVSYSKGAPNPKHHGQVMRSAMKAEWIKSQQAKWTVYGVAASFRRFSVHLSPHRPCFHEPFPLKDKAKRGGI